MPLFPIKAGSPTRISSSGTMLSSGGFEWARDSVFGALGLLAGDHSEFVLVVGVAGEVAPTGEAAGFLDLKNERGIEINIPFCRLIILFLKSADLRKETQAPLDHAGGS